MYMENQVKHLMGEPRNGMKQYKNILFRTYLIISNKREDKLEVSFYLRYHRAFLSQRECCQVLFY